MFIRWNIKAPSHWFPNSTQMEVEAPTGVLIWLIVQYDTPWFAPITGFLKILEADELSSPMTIAVGWPGRCPRKAEKLYREQKSTPLMLRKEKLVTSQGWDGSSEVWLPWDESAETRL